MNNHLVADCATIGRHECPVRLLHRIEVIVVYYAAVSEIVNHHNWDCQNHSHDSCHDQPDGDTESLYHFDIVNEIGGPSTPFLNLKDLNLIGEERDDVIHLVL